MIAIPPAPTPEQLAAARFGPRGPLLIAAGPGTGKTFTMVERYRWLVEQQRVTASSILAVTFTERAAAELRERLERELRTSLDEAWIGTFHGVCARLLRENAYLVGVPRELRVLDDVDQRLLLERLQARLRSGEDGVIDIESLTALNPDEVSDLLKNGLRFALKLKGRGILPDAFRARALELHAGLCQGNPTPLYAVAEREAIEVLHRVYSAYQGWLAAEGRADFDDLILGTISALERVPEFRHRCRQLFRHVLVDEFQDTNRIQLDLLRLLSADGFENVSVVGDAKQSIYGWRDAEIANIRSFPGALRPLTRNRRSVQEILDCATDFIRLDPGFREEPPLVAERGPAGEPAVSVVMASGSGLEARLVAAEIRRLIDSGRRAGSIAVLAHSVKHLPREFEEELRSHQVPYVTSGGSGFFDREEVKDVLGLLRLAADPMDDGALVRVLQGPVVRVGDAAIYRLASRRFGTRGLRLRDCLEAARKEGFPELDPATARRLAQVIGVCDALGAARDALTVADVLNRLLEETGYLRHCALRASREGPRALLNLRKVFAMASRFERDQALAGLGDFVRHLDHIMSAELPIGEAELEAPDAVQVLTVHAAKGLEFDVVFLVNLKPPNPRDTERLFFDPDSFGFVMKWWRNDRHPRFRANLPGSEALVLARQERRRAVYVALTRAKDLLYVSASRAEGSPAEIEPGEDDHFGELVRWAVANPQSAQVIQAEQLALAELGGEAPAPAGGRATIAAVVERLRTLASGESAAPPAERARVALSFSQLHQFQLCPVRYRYQEVWKVPVPPDELLTRPARLAGAAGAELGASVHSALETWHGGGGDLLQLYQGPAGGRELLERYLAHPISREPTLATEREFNLRLGETRVKGLVDRVTPDALIDYKTNARLDQALLEAYSTQLRLYGLAAARGLLPGSASPRLLLFDLRRGEAVEVRPDPEGVQSEVESVAERIRGGDFSLGPEHQGRPCFLCGFRPICPDRR